MRSFLSKTTVLTLATATLGVAHAGTPDIHVTTQISNGLAPALGFDVIELTGEEGPNRFIIGKKDPSFLEFLHDGRDVCVSFWVTLKSDAIVNCQPADDSTRGPVTIYESGITMSVEVSTSPLAPSTEPDGIMAYDFKDCPPPSELVYTEYDNRGGFLGSVSEWAGGKRLLSFLKYPSNHKIVVAECFERGAEPGSIGGGGFDADPGQVIGDGSGIWSGSTPW